MGDGGYAKFYAYGDLTKGLYDDSGLADWGKANAGDLGVNWRTLTKEEWNYVLNTRSTPSGINYAKAVVNSVNGLILLPDDWDANYYGLNDANTTTVDFTSNAITLSNWTSLLEPYGAVFLPAAGQTNNGYVSSVGTNGYYWSASPGSNQSMDGSAISFDYYSMNHNLGRRRCYASSVRLVMDVN